MFIRATIAALALLGAATGCSGSDDGGQAQAFANDNRNATSVDELLADNQESSETAVLERASDALESGPTPIGPNTRVILNGPPFEGLSSLATGCVLERQAQDSALADLFNAAVLEQRIALADVVALRASSVDCAPDEVAVHFANQVAQRAKTIIPEAAVGCMGAVLDQTASTDPNIASSPLTGLTAIDLDQPVPQPAAEATVALLASCFDGQSIGPTLRATIATQPTMANAADSACIDSALLADGASYGFWSRFVQRAGVEADTISPETDAEQWSAIESCFSVGNVVSGVLSGYGFPISQTTVGCLDEGASDRSIVGRVLGGEEPDPAEFMPLLAECASAEELQAISAG